MLSTNPAPGSSVSEGSVVDIVVSSGKNSPKTLRYDVGLPSGVDQVHPAESIQKRNAGGHADN